MKLPYDDVSLHLSSQLYVQCHRVGSLALVRVFTLWKLADFTNQDLCFLREPVFRYLQQYTTVYMKIHLENFKYKPHTPSPVS